MPAKMTRELTAAGFTGVRECPAGAGPCRWATCDAPDGRRVAVAKQAPGIWHLWELNGATVSGHEPAALVNGHGGLGDVIDTDGQLRAYGRLVDAAPRHVYMAFPLGPSR